MTKYSLTPPPTQYVHCINRRRNHRIAYSDWGPRDAESTLMCVHGLSRNRHDFDALAHAWSDSRRIITMDLIGRGDSDWLRDSNDYNILQYNLDFTILAARAGVPQYDYLGTSLGGLMGISLASLKDSPIRRLVINDIAPEVPSRAISRLVKYIGDEPEFDSLLAVEDYLRSTLAPFGPMTDLDWQHMAEHGAKRSDNGYRLNFDPTIVNNFRRYWPLTTLTLWRYWEKIQCPVLILRGKDSDFLTPQLAAKMLRRLPTADIVEFEGVGHVPSLNSPEQLDVVLEWLNSK